MDDSHDTQELRKLFAEARVSEISLDDLEAKVVDLFQESAAGMNRRFEKAEEQIEQMEVDERNNNANTLLYRSLVSEYQMMLDELTSGAYIHVGRIEEYGYSRRGCCGESCKAAAERDSMKAELSSLHNDYSKVFYMYKKVRDVAENQKIEYEQLHQKFLEKAKDVESLQGNMACLREDAKKKLDQAAKVVEECLRERDRSLLRLKLKVRQLEMELKTCQGKLQIKKSEVNELRDICQQLMSQMEPDSDLEQSSFELDPSVRKLIA